MESTTRCTHGYKASIGCPECNPVVEIVQGVNTGRVYSANGVQLDDNPCGKPHNNGEDTCNECEVIKKGV